MKKLSKAKQAVADKARKTPDFYAWMIDYRNPVENYTGAMGGSYHGPELDKAKAQRDENAKYYTDMGYEILPSSTFGYYCGACGGTGTLYLPGKRHVMFSRGPAFTCPFCNAGTPRPTVAECQAEVKRLQDAGWTKTDFATALKNLLS